jgi:hypothetical protein
MLRTVLHTHILPLLLTRPSRSSRARVHRCCLLLALPGEVASPAPGQDGLPVRVAAPGTLETRLPVSRLRADAQTSFSQCSHTADAAGEAEVQHTEVPPRRQVRRSSPLGHPAGGAVSGKDGCCGPGCSRVACHLLAVHTAVTVSSRVSGRRRSRVSNPRAAVDHLRLDSRRPTLLRTGCAHSPVV